MSEFTGDYYDEILEHHGILGQKIHDIRTASAVSEGYEPLGVPGFSTAATRKGGRAFNADKYSEVASKSTTFIRKGESGYDTKHISSAASGVSMRDLYELYKAIS